MFTHLRQAGKSLLTKLVLALLVFIFGLWGIGDVLRTGGGPSIIATVGKTAIPVQEYKAAVQRTHGQPQQVLSGLINDALIEQETAAMGIVVNDDTVADYIQTLKEFQGADGRFDKELYKQLLANNGFSEHRYIEEVRHEIGARLLIGSLTGDVQVPGQAVQALYKINEEQRTADLLRLSAASVQSQVAAPSEQEIKSYYEAHPKDFTTPEVRTVSYVALPLADVQSKIQVSDDEVRRMYDEHKEDFRRPEHRQVEQMVFENEADAKKASDQIAKGGDFDTLAKTAHIINKDKLAIGDIAQQDLPPEAVSAGVGTLKEGGSSAPVKSDFGWHIFHVVKITPEGILPFDAAKADIAKDSAARQAQDTVVKMMNGFEDALAGGATLDKAADSIGEKVKSVGPITREGNGPDGKKADLPPYDGFLNVAFSIAEKEHSQAVQATDGSYFLVRVDDVKPEHVRPLADVKTEAAKAAMAEKVSAKLEKTAETVSEQLRAGKSLDSVLAAAGLAVRPAASGNLKHNTESVPEGPLKDKPLSRGLLSELFHLQPKESTHAYPVGDGSYMIATVASIIPAPEKMDEKNAAKIRDDLKETYMDDVLHQYLAYLRGKYPVSIHAEALGAMKDDSSGQQ